MRRPASQEKMPAGEAAVTARRVFQRLLYQSPTPERCLEVFHLQRTRFEMIVERMVRLRQLTDDGNIEITGGDLRERIAPMKQNNFSAYLAADRPD
jgi:hypothetical protein